MKMTIGAAMAMALMLSLPMTTLAQPAVPAAPTDAADVSAGAVDTAAQEADNASNAAIDTAKDASDAAGDATESSSEAVKEEAQAANDRAVEAKQASEDTANELNSELADDADRNGDNRDANSDNLAPQLDADAQLRADAAAQSQTNINISDEDRNASWRFVERDGVWWYRTPMNSWMIHQDGEWNAQPYAVGYRGAQQAQYYNHQHGQPTHHGQQQAYYNDGYHHQGVQQTAHHQQGEHGWGEDHPRVGQQEWMCIDGRRTLVTVVSVSPASTEQGGQYSPERAGSPEDGQQPMPAAPQDNWQDGDQGQPANQQNDRLTPPPVPQPNDDASKQTSDHPDAPSMDRLQASSTSASSQSYSAAKPVTEGQPADAAVLNDSTQAPAEPQPTYQSGQASQSSQPGPADGSFEGDADRNGGRQEATNIRD